MGSGSLPSRGKEATCYLIKGGVTLEGSFFQVKSWSFTPDAEIRKNMYVGNKTSKRDIVTDGGSFKLELDVSDDKVVRFWAGVVARDQNAQEPEAVTLVILQKHRSPSNPSVTIALKGSVAKLDEYGAGGMKDNLNSTLSGEYEEMTPL